MYGITLKVWGDWACFTRPEMKVERVSYDVITPSASRGIIESIYFKPAIRWIIDEIHILNPVEFTTIKRNEVSAIVPVNSISKSEKENIYLNTNSARQQRSTIMLKNVAYIIKAHFEMTDKAGADETPAKHYNIFLRRARKGQCFNQPYFGCREFGAKYELIEEDMPLEQAIPETKDLGYMLYDIDFLNDKQPIFFRAQMNQGIIEIPGELKEKVNKIC